MKMTDSDKPQVPTVIFGTVSGAIGVIASISKEDFDFFRKLEQRLAMDMKGVGGIPHSK